MEIYHKTIDSMISKFISVHTCACTCTFIDRKLVILILVSIQCSSELCEPKYTRNTRQPDTHIRVYCIRIYAYTVYARMPD